MSTRVTADPAAIERFGSDAARSGDALTAARRTLDRAAIEPAADRFGLLRELTTSETEARGQVLDALHRLAAGCDDLDRSAGDFAEAFRVAGRVR